MNEPENNFELPPALRQDLKSIHTPGDFPQALDRTILDRAKRTAEAQQMRRRWRIVAAVGLAAAIAITAGIFFTHYGSIENAAPQPPQEAYTPTGDIRDAFYLARKIKAHEPLDGQWDVNHDGVVDKKDVEWLAQAAVKITKGTAP